MAIFSSQTLEQILKENAASLPRGKVEKHRKALNAMPRTLKLADEWEVVLLHAFGKLGRIIHEDGNIAGTCDLYFESREEPAINFLADITTISDEGFKNYGDFKGLEKEMARRVEIRGLNPNHFHLSPNDNHREIQRGSYYLDAKSSRLKYGFSQKARLFTGKQNSWAAEIFNERWERFLDVVMISTKPRTYWVISSSAEIDVKIFFDTSHSGSGYLEHKQINDLQRNALMYALREKADQLAKARFPGHRGIIVCDGGYTPFHALPNFATHSVKAVIERFLRDNPSISFVATLSVTARPLCIDSHYCVSATIDSIINVIDSAVALLPIQNTMREMLETT